MIYRHFGRFPEVREFPEERRGEVWVLFLKENRIHGWARSNPRRLLYAFVIPGMILGITLGYWIAGGMGRCLVGAAMGAFSLYLSGIVVHSNLLRPALKHYLQTRAFQRRTEIWRRAVA
jgi:hypothetical protein